jgi:hypothetical protein
LAIMKARTRRKLFDIDVDEISLVDNPANRRRFAIIKRAKMDIQKAVEEFFKLTDPEEQVALEAAEKDLSEDAKDAIVKAVALLKKYLKDFPSDVGAAVAVLAGAVGEALGEKPGKKPEGDYGYGYPGKKVDDPNLPFPKVMSKSGPDKWHSFGLVVQGGAGYLLQKSGTDDADPDDVGLPEPVPERRGARKSVDGQDAGGDDDQPADKWPSL